MILHILGDGERTLDLVNLITTERLQKIITILDHILLKIISLLNFWEINQGYFEAVFRVYHYRKQWKIIED